MNVRLFIAVVASLTCFSVSAGAQTQPVTLEWDPTPEAVAGYVVYVGQASGVYTEQYNVGDRTSFSYTKAVPGRPYYFAVAAYAAGLQIGAPSEEVLFLSGAAVSAPPRSASNVVGTEVERAAVSSTPGAQVACGIACHGGELVVSVPGRADSMVATGDGRLLFIENGTRVRAVVDGTLVPHPLLSADGTTQFTDLVLDPDFARTGFLYVAVAEGGADGARRLNVVRYREVANQLGEGAVLVAELPLATEGDASLAIDAARRLYVAMPSALEGEPGASRYAGMILRFEIDGTTVRDDGSDAPVFSRGYAKPASMAWSAPGNALWLAGTGAGWPATIAILPTEARASGISPIPVDGALAPGAAVIGLSASARNTAERGNGKVPAGAVFIDEAGGVFRSTMTPDGLVVTPWIPAGAFQGVPTSIASAPSENATYIAVAGASQADAPETRIIKLH